MRFGGDSQVTSTDLSRAINGLLGAAPQTLDTLAELAAAVNNDPTAFADLTASKVSKTGDTMTGTLSTVNRTETHTSVIYPIGITAYTGVEATGSNGSPGSYSPWACFGASTWSNYWAGGNVALEYSCPMAFTSCTFYSMNTKRLEGGQLSFSSDSTFTTVYNSMSPFVFANNTPGSGSHGGYSCEVWTWTFPTVLRTDSQNKIYFKSTAGHPGYSSALWFWVSGVATVEAAPVSMSYQLDMTSNKIVNVTNGSASGDAVAYGQLADYLTTSSASATYQPKLTDAIGLSGTNASDSGALYLDNKTYLKNGHCYVPSGNYANSGLLYAPGGDLIFNCSNNVRVERPLNVSGNAYFGLENNTDKSLNCAALMLHNYATKTPSGDGYENTCFAYISGDSTYGFDMLCGTNQKTRIQSDLEVVGGVICTDYVCAAGGFMTSHTGNYNHLSFGGAGVGSTPMLTTATNSYDTNVGFEIHTKGAGAISLNAPVTTPVRTESAHSTTQTYCSNLLNANRGTTGTSASPGTGSAWHCFRPVAINGGYWAGGQVNLEFAAPFTCSCVTIWHDTTVGLSYTNIGFANSNSYTVWYATWDWKLNGIHMGQETIGSTLCDKYVCYFNPVPTTGANNTLYFYTNENGSSARHCRVELSAGVQTIERVPMSVPALIGSERTSRAGVAVTGSYTTLLVLDLYRSYLGTVFCGYSSASHALIYVQTYGGTSSVSVIVGSNLDFQISGRNLQVKTTNSVGYTLWCSLLPLGGNGYF